MVGAPNLKVQMDLYHCQIVEGDVAMKIRKYLPTGRVGHFQIAGVPAAPRAGPGRAQPRLPVRGDRRGGGRLRLARLDRLRIPAGARCGAGRELRRLGWFKPWRV